MLENLPSSKPPTDKRVSSSNWDTVQSELVGCEKKHTRSKSMSVQSELRKKKHKRSKSASKNSISKSLVQNRKRKSTSKSSDDASTSNKKKHKHSTTSTTETKQFPLLDNMYKAIEFLQIYDETTSHKLYKVKEQLRQFLLATPFATHSSHCFERCELLVLGVVENVTRIDEYILKVIDGKDSYSFYAKKVLDSKMLISIVRLCVCEAMQEGNKSTKSIAKKGVKLYVLLTEGQCVEFATYFKEKIRAICKLVQGG